MQVVKMNQRMLERAVLERLRRNLEPAVHMAVQEVLQGERRTHNGIQEPAQGKLRDIWNAFNQFSNPAGATLSVAMAMAQAKGFNPNSTRIQFYRWRAFYGYSKAH